MNPRPASPTPSPTRLPGIRALTGWLVCLALAACQPPPSTATLPAKTINKTAEATSPAHTKPAPARQPEPLLAGLPARDIARAEAMAKRVYAPIWPAIAKRSGFVRGRLLAELARQGAPASLQVIPVVESGYDPYAFSRAGAMGLWQLMPGTARVLKLRAPRGINPRRHVETATQGAARYLMQMKSRFGNWPLALAAYHRGPAAIARRLRRHPWSPADGLDALPVPPVTRSYVRSILGLAALVDRGVLAFPEATPMRELVLPAPADLRLLTRAADVPLDALFRFNPGLDHSQYLSTPVTIHVPAMLYDRLLAATSEARPRHVRIRIHPGDNLWNLARRHHTTVTHLKRINRLSRTTLRPGQTLLVPASAFNAAAPAPNPLLARGRRIRYRVRPGDNLWNIAKRFGASPWAIARANGLKANAMLHPGDRLWILARIRPS